jgi:hypothetical protein
MRIVLKLADEPVFVEGFRSLVKNSDNLPILVLLCNVEELYARRFRSRVSAGGHGVARRKGRALSPREGQKLGHVGVFPREQLKGISLQAV